MIDSISHLTNVVQNLVTSRFENDNTVGINTANTKHTAASLSSKNKSKQTHNVVHEVSTSQQTPKISSVNSSGTCLME